MALTRWPTEPAPWLLTWTIWKLRGEQGPRPWNAPAKIPAHGWEFYTWVLWRRKNRPPPRPDIIEIIPKWAYIVLKQVMVAVPLVEPPPPPPLPNPDPPDSWSLPLPIMTTAWGFMNDSDWRDTDAGLDRCVTAGFKTILLQGGQFKAIDAERCRDKGLHVAVWGSPSSNDANYLDVARAEGYVTQIETPDEYRNAVRNLEAGVGAGLSIAMYTTFGGLFTYTSRNVGTPQERPTTVETEVLASLGCTRAFVECYQGDMTPMDVSTMMLTGERWRGLYYLDPVIGLSGIHGVPAYQPDIAEYGRRFGVYVAEPLRTIDWAALRVL